MVIRNCDSIILNLKTIQTKSLFYPLLCQNDEGSSLNADHIVSLITCLRDNIQSPDRKQLSSGLLDLRSTLLAAAIPLNSLQVVLFNFQDAVSPLCARIFAGLEVQHPPLFHIS